jgi:cephalosporin hydroxylase
MQSDHISDTTLAEIERLHREASAPPWVSLGSTVYIGDTPVEGAVNAALIVALRNAIGPLLAAREEAQRLREVLKEITDEYEDHLNGNALGHPGCIAAARQALSGASQL